MAFGDQVNRQTSLTGKHHECKRYLEQYPFTCHPLHA
ncbi:MAG: hypothetical protein ACJA13_003411 [Paraglaciecola sp.]|jgi:hypothetical protein